MELPIASVRIYVGRNEHLNVVNIGFLSETSKQIGEYFAVRGWDTKGNKGVRPFCVASLLQQNVRIFRKHETKADTPDNQRVRRQRERTKESESFMA